MIAMIWDALIRDVLLVEEKVPPPRINNLFRGIAISPMNEIHELIRLSLLPGRSAKGNLAWCLHSFLHVFQGISLQNVSQFNREELQIKGG